MPMTRSNVCRSRTKVLLHGVLFFTCIILAVFPDFSFSHTILEEYNCQQDDVQYRVTLKGGTMAGVFKDHGRVKNIQECAHLCCTAKKCDVAMMYGRKCLGVQCFNETSCETIPSDDPQLDLQIVHVSSKGTGNLVKANASDPTKFNHDAKCPHNEVMYNVKLKAGLSAGKFTDIGKVKSIMTCIRYCCDAKVECDLAFMLESNCYLVKCYSEDRCQALPAPGIDYSFKQKMAFVAPWLYEKNKKVVKVPSGQSPHHLQCIQSHVHTRSRLLGGPEAGDFTDVGKVKMHICTRLCCEDASCDLAYMFGKSCFLVKCYNEKGCRAVKEAEDPVKKLVGKPVGVRVDKSIQYIIKRRFGVKVRDDGTTVMPGREKDKLCQIDGEIRNKTVLQAGMLAGRLTSHRGVKDITSCIQKCCESDQCHVAMMMGAYCYSVSCANSDYCKPKTAPKETHHKNPTIAYVKRGKITFAPQPRLSKRSTIRQDERRISHLQEAS